MTNYYIYGPGLLYRITETASSTNTLTYHYDYRGSTVAITDGNGNVTDRIQYSAYGMITLRGGTNDTPFLLQRPLRGDDRCQWPALHAGAVLQPLYLPVHQS